MPRFYTEISKEEFLTKVRNLMETEDDEFPYELPTAIEKDLSKVNFDWENYTTFGEKTGYAKYPVGYRKLADNFHIYFVNAGGDWEYPICFIFYWGDGKLRAYIPSEGNVWNKKEKCAYGSEEDLDYNNPPQLGNLDLQISEPKMISEIFQHITKKV